MKKSIKVISLLLMLAIMLFSLTGCMTTRYNVSINRDGSGDVNYVYAVNKSILESMEVSVDQMVADMKTTAEKENYTVEAYDDGVFAGFEASKHLNDIQSEFSLQEAFGEKYVKDTEENKIKIEKNGNTTKYSQNAKIDLTSMADMKDAGLIIDYTVTLPVKASSNNASEVSEDGKILIWHLKAGEINEISFEATSKGAIADALADSNTVWIIVASVSAVVIVAAVVVLIVVLKKKKTKNEELK